MNSWRLVDTNVLVYAANSASEYHEKCLAFLEGTLPEADLAIAIQNITEFYATVTNSKLMGKPFTQDEVIQDISQFLKIYHILSPTTKTPQTIVSLLKKCQVKAQEIHDLHLAATMLDNSIGTIITADANIFQKLGLEVISPLL